MQMVFKKKSILHTSIYTSPKDNLQNCLTLSSYACNRRTNLQFAYIYQKGEHKKCELLLESNEGCQKSMTRIYVINIGQLSDEITGKIFARIR